MEWKYLEAVVDDLIYVKPETFGEVYFFIGMCESIFKNPECLKGINDEVQAALKELHAKVVYYVDEIASQSKDGWDLVDFPQWQEIKTLAGSTRDFILLHIAKISQRDKSND